MCCSSIALENRMSLQMLIRVFELVPMAEKLQLLREEIRKVLVNKIWSGTAAVLMSVASSPLSNCMRTLNIIKMKAQLVKT